MVKVRVRVDVWVLVMVRVDAWVMVRVKIRVGVNADIVGYPGGCSHGMLIAKIGRELVSRGHEVCCGED